MRIWEHSRTDYNARSAEVEENFYFDVRERGSRIVPIPKSKAPFYLVLFFPVFLILNVLRANCTNMFSSKRPCRRTFYLRTYLLSNFLGYDQSGPSYETSLRLTHSLLCYVTRTLSKSLSSCVATGSLK